MKSKLNKAREVTPICGKNKTEGQARDIRTDPSFSLPKRKYENKCQNFEAPFPSRVMDEI